MTSNPNLEFYKLKVFLYKYTPPISLAKAETTAQAITERYTIPLEEQYYSKYDISDLVTSYNFSQDIDQNTFSWNLVLQDKVISFPDWDNSYRVEGVPMRTLLDRLASYESRGLKLADKPVILTAKQVRGYDTSEFITSGLNENNGVYVSDAVQPYDLLSVYLYKSENPLEELRGVVAEDSATNLKKFTLNPAGGLLKKTDLQQETVLETIPGFSNELNGFVLNKSFSRTIGQVNSLTIAGNGITRLLGATRRLLKPDIGINSIFTVSQETNILTFSGFQHVFADKTISAIFGDLFNIVYKMDFSEQSSIYNISKLLISHNLNSSMFVIPPYLLALVMRNRGFKTITPRDINTSSNAYQDAARSGSAAGQNQILTSSSHNIVKTSEAYKSPITFDPKVSKELAYFKYVSQVFTSFNPETATPFDIIAEIKQKALVEFFEKPGGTIIIREPKYNETTEDYLLKSSSFDVVSTNYSESVENLISRQSVGYGIDFVPQMPAFTNKFYNHGKLFQQFGWLEASAGTNPNFKVGKSSNTDTTKTQDQGLFEYCKFLLRVHNASLYNGSITLSYDPRLEIGKTFFDEKNYKFGYITGLTKNVNVSGAVAVTIELSYVRDAYSYDGIQLTFERLPTIQDINEKFEE